MVVRKISNIKKIDKILKKYWKESADKEKPVKPKFKVLLFYFEENGKMEGFLYVYDINDGYFHECIIDDLSTGEKFNNRIITKLFESLKIYCKKEKIESININAGRYEYNCKSEIKLYKKLGFEINEKETSATFFIK